MALNWADRRRTMVIGGFILIGLTLLAGLIIAVIYETPSCMDGKQNQDETGIDCGGSCEYLCRASIVSPNVSNVPAFVRAVSHTGRTDVIAYVENRNRNAEAKDAPYTVEVFDESGRLLGRREGTVDLPAQSTVPLFVPGIAQGVSGAPRAFVSFGDHMRWRAVRTEQIPLRVSSADIIPGDGPKVRAVLTNPAAEGVYDRMVVATVFDSEGLAIAASRTVVRQVQAFGTSEVVFTWAEPFGGVPARVEVLAVPVIK